MGVRVRFVLSNRELLTYNALRSFNFCDVYTCWEFRGFQGCFYGIGCIGLNELPLLVGYVDMFNDA